MGYACRLQSLGNTRNPGQVGKVRSKNWTAIGKVHAFATVMWFFGPSFGVLGRPNISMPRLEP